MSDASASSPALIDTTSIISITVGSVSSAIEAGVSLLDFQSNDHVVHILKEEWFSRVNLHEDAAKSHMPAVQVHLSHSRPEFYIWCRCPSFLLHSEANFEVLVLGFVCDHDSQENRGLAFCGCPGTSDP